MSVKDSACGLCCASCAFKEPCNCGGCLATGGHPFYGECPLATCCIQKGYSHCGHCSEMPCDRLYEFSVLDKEHGDNPPGARIETLRQWRREETAE